MEAPNGPAPSRSSDVEDDWPLWTDKHPVPGLDIHAKFRALRSEEHKVLSVNRDALLSVKNANNFISRVFTETSRYLRFVFETWSGIFFMTFFGGVGPFDMFTMWLYALGGSVVLFLILIFCLATSSPLFGKGDMNMWSLEGKPDQYIERKNESLPNLYRGFTKEQLEMAMKGLSGKDIRSVNHKIERVFDLDVAKLLVRFCAVIYEFKNEPLRATLPGDAHPLGSEGRNWRDWLLKMINFPDLLFDPTKFTSTVPPAPPTPPSPSQTEKPKESSSKAKGNDEGASHIRGFLKVLDKTEHHDLQWETVSQLGDTSSAVAGLIWKPKSNWIAVVFKGTSPVEYGEWISNLNSKLAPVGSHIHGFRRVHKGFKERVFPSDSSTTRMHFGARPYDTIALGIRTLAKHLWKELPDGKKEKVNVWFTGHSLGCSTATLVYAQLLNTRDNQYMALRDAYLFAAPIVCDRESVDIFNAQIFQTMDKAHPRTMWRITSGNDFVATCLPELGDFRDLIASPNNAFAFAHLGTEIKLQNASRKCLVTGNHLQFGTHVEIASRFSRDELVAQYEDSLLKKHTTPGVNGWEGEEQDAKEVNRLWWASLKQQVPFFAGRLLAHSTVNYVDQLNRVRTGDCEWISNLN